MVGADPVEILRFYVDARQHGRGLAAELMAESLRTARSETVYLGVWEKNARALAFYAKHGFRAVGEHDFYLGDERQRDLILQRFSEARA